MQNGSQTRPSPERVLRPRVTINDLADALGLTKSTVSRALNGYPDIAEGTRKRVQRQAQIMDYRPLSHAQAIRTGRTRAVGLVLQTDLPGAGRPFIANFLGGITGRLGAEGWTLTVATALNEQDMLQTLERLIEERKADGFVLPRTLADDPRVELLRRHDIPFVMFGRTGDPTDCAWFDIASETAMRAAVARLAGFGHERIALVNGEIEYTFSRLRDQGFRTGMAEAGLTVDANLIRNGAMTLETGAAAARHLLDLPAPPTAIVYAVDIAALGAYVAAAERGLTIGRDLSVIGYDGVPEGAFATPPLTTFDVDMEHAGARLAALLMQRIRGAQAEDLRELTNARLVVRGSDGPPVKT